MTKTLHLIDGSGFIFRAYHALPPLTNPQGIPVGAVYGFVNMLIKLMEGNQCDYVAVVFDAARHTFRNRIYAEYKANRPPAPDDLVPQFPLVREAARALNLRGIELADFEADDIIATYARQAQAQGIHVTIVSSDKDLMQLIGEGITMYDAMKQKPIGEAEVKEKFGVTPDKVLEVLSLIGDSSDNVPGIPGIGPKTAAELISQFGDLETLLANASSIKQPKRRESLIQYADQARLSRELITLKMDVPLPPLEELLLKAPDPALLMPFLEQHGFKTLSQRMRQKLDQKLATIMPIATCMAPALQSAAENAAASPAAIKADYAILRDEASLKDWVEKATRQGLVAFDTETTGLNAMQAELVGFSLCTAAGSACYVPLAHVVQGAAEQASLFGDGGDAPVSRQPASGQIPLASALALIKPMLEDDSVLKVGHNIKYDMLIMRRYGVRMTAMEDSMLLSYVLHAGKHGHGMDELAERYLGHTTISYAEVTAIPNKRGGRLRFDEVDIETAGQYAAEDADITLRLYQLFKPLVVSERLLTLYDTIERPLIDVLGAMEMNGIKADTRQLAALSCDFAARMQALEQAIHALAGQPFNVGSPKQLGEVLFDRLQLSGGQRSPRKSAKSGAYSTSNDVLEDLAGQGHELPAKIIEWRQLSKLKSTYSDALAGQVDPATGRVHTCFAMAITSTGRLSSSDPNLQNIPIRTSEGKKIRKAFIATEGCQLISADYSQIELRLLAHMADIGTLKEAFNHGADIHAITASQMFGIPVEAVDSSLRRSAKTINFGIIYGISAHGLATRLGISRGEAASYIERYFAQYPGIRDYMEDCKAFARTHGYVVTLMGRRCYIPGIQDKNGARRQFSERAAINAPLQGSAADIIKHAMITIHNQLLNRKDARMLLQVHDELVFEVTENAASEIESMVKRHMEQAVSLSVPLTVETGIGKDWGEIH